MEKLITLLKVETQTLKVEFINRSKEFAKHEHGRMVERSNWSDQQWCEHLGLEAIEKTDFQGKTKMSWPKNFWNMKESRIHDRQFWAAKKVANINVETYIEKSATRAESHYNNSIEKLAIRIMKKGLNVDKITATTAHIDVNINTVLTDGDKTVRAYTIIAGGPVQKPHYRYLIK